MLKFFFKKKTIYIPGQYLIQDRTQTTAEIISMLFGVRDMTNNVEVELV